MKLGLSFWIGLTIALLILTATDSFGAHSLRITNGGETTETFRIEMALDAGFTEEASISTPELLGPGASSGQKLAFGPVGYTVYVRAFYLSGGSYVAADCVPVSIVTNNGTTYFVCTVPSSPTPTPTPSPTPLPNKTLTVSGDITNFGPDPVAMEIWDSAVGAWEQIGNIPVDPESTHYDFEFDLENYKGQRLKVRVGGIDIVDMQVPLEVLQDYFGEFPDLVFGEAAEDDPYEDKQTDNTPPPVGSGGSPNPTPVPAPSTTNPTPRPTPDLVGGPPPAGGPFGGGPSGDDLDKDDFYDAIRKGIEDTVGDSANTYEAREDIDISESDVDAVHAAGQAADALSELIGRMDDMAQEVGEVYELFRVRFPTSFSDVPILTVNLPIVGAMNLNFEEVPARNAIKGFFRAVILFFGLLTAMAIVKGAFTG